MLLKRKIETELPELFSEINFGGYGKLINFLKSFRINPPNNIRIKAWGYSSSFYHFQKRLLGWIHLSEIDQNSAKIERVPYLNPEEIIFLNSKIEASRAYRNFFNQDNRKFQNKYLPLPESPSKDQRILKREIGQSGRHNYFWDVKQDFPLDLRKNIQSKYLVEDFESILIEFSVQFSTISESEIFSKTDIPPESRFLEKPLRHQMLIPIFISLICSNQYAGFGGILFEASPVSLESLVNKYVSFIEKKNTVSGRNLSFKNLSLNESEILKNNQERTPALFKRPLWNGELEKIVDPGKYYLKNSLFKLIKEIDLEIFSHTFLEKIHSFLGDVAYSGNFGIDMYIVRYGKKIFWKPISECNFRETYALLGLKYLKKYNNSTNKNRFFYLPNLTNKTPLLQKKMEENYIITLL